jgi:hypothetical protein
MTKAKAIRGILLRDTMMAMAVDSYIEIKFAEIAPTTIHTAALLMKRKGLGEWTVKQNGKQLITTIIRLS